MDSESKEEILRWKISNSLKYMYLWQKENLEILCSVQTIKYILNCVQSKFPLDQGFSEEILEMYLGVKE